MFSVYTYNIPYELSRRFWLAGRLFHFHNSFDAGKSFAFLSVPPRMEQKHT